MGPNINNSSRGPDREIRRYVALAQQAAAESPGAASPLERALTQAMAVRYGRAETQAQKLYQAQGSAM